MVVPPNHGERTGNGSPPIQSLNVFLLKSGADDPAQALREDAGKLVRHTLKRSLPFKGALWIAPQRKSPPTWLDFLEQGTARDIGGLFNASTSALLFVQASRRWFAFTFGYGRALLAPSRYERRFGLKVVLNTVDPEQLHGVDAKTVHELTVHTRKQVSRGSRFEAFALDKEIDMLSGVAGTPKDASFASAVAGADALHLRARVEFEDLGSKCSDILRAYRSTAYRREFEFIDHVRPLTDPVLLEQLGDRLVDALQARSLDRIHLAPPAIVDWDKTDGFSYSKKGERTANLGVTDFLDSLRRGDDISVDRLRRQQIYRLESGKAEPTESWSAHDCMVAEVDHARRRYVLSGGDWYEIDKSFVDKVHGRVKKMKEARLGLPDASEDQDERKYNEGAAKKRGVYLCDRKCIREGGSPIELCDLYTSGKQFVHVKPWKSSSTLSHLFAQGVVSAETLLSDEKFRKNARKLLERENASLGAHIPLSRLTPQSYQVVFAIIKKKTRDWRSTLPFFSQLNLIRAVEALSRLGFEPRIECINVRD